MKKEYLFLFLLFSIFTFENIANICKIHFPLSYDNQIFLTWEYSAWIGQLPYKDIFFPYGILYYYKNTNMFFSLLYLSLAPFLFTFFYFIFLKFSKERVFSLISVFSLFLFITNLTGYETFTRYGLVTAMACGYAYIFSFSKNNLNKTTLLLLGLLNGVILTFFNDQGIYSFVLFFLFIFIDAGIKRMYKHIFSTFLFFSFGFILGMLPYAFYLLIHQSFWAFLLAVLELSDLSQFAKTPFFHGIATIDNLFTFLVLFVSIFFVSYRIFLTNQKIFFTTYLQIGLIMVIVMLEQKNIIRSTDRQLTFIALLLLMSLFYELKVFLQTRGITKKQINIYYVTILFIITFVIGLHPFPTMERSTSCFDVRKRFSVYDKELLFVKKEVEKIPGFHGKIFSYPGDMVFYLLFEQSPPYYPTIYEASSLNAQKKQISYIKNNHIDYILYHYTNVSIQDEVPNVIRGAYLHRYLLQNYGIKKIIGNFFVLQKNKTKKDFFTDKNLHIVPKYKQSLLHVYLGSIPESEGIYKKQYLTESTIHILSSGTLATINTYFKKQKVSSGNTLLFITFKEKKQNQKSTLVIKTSDNKSTAIQFDTCKKEVPCIIHLSQLPLFYTNRLIENIILDKKSMLHSISLVKGENVTKFW